MKNAIIIKTKDLPIVIEVDNFSKENCINAIGKFLKINVLNLEQLSASYGSGIFGVKSTYLSIVDIVTNPVKDRGYKHTIEVEYGKIT